MYTFLFPIILCLYHPPRFEYLNNVWCGVQIMKPRFLTILYTFCTPSFLKQNFNHVAPVAERRALCSNLVTGLAVVL